MAATRRLTLLAWLLSISSVTAFLRPAHLPSAATRATLQRMAAGAGDDTSSDVVAAGDAAAVSRRAAASTLAATVALASTAGGAVAADETFDVSFTVAIDDKTDGEGEWA